MKIARREEEDRRRLGRECQGLISERISLDRLDLLLAQIKAVETERNTMLAEMARLEDQPQASHPLAMLWAWRASAWSLPPPFGWSAFTGLLPIAGRSPPMRVLRPRPGRVASLRMSRCVEGGQSAVRTKMIRLVWRWLRHQPQSALTCWLASTGAIASYVFWPVSVVHVTLAKMLLALITLHALAALWHMWVKRDGTMERLVPLVALRNRRARGN